MTIYIKRNSFFARIAAWWLKEESMAMVWGRTILLYNTSPEQFLRNERWVKHELEHIRQFQQMGYLKFLFKYLVESIRNGYYNNKFEQQARAAEEGVINMNEYQVKIL